MPFSFAPYVAADHCDSVEYMPGTKALAAFIEDWYAYQWSMGIYNCRPPRGGTGYSHHAEARAYDSGVPVINAETPDKPKGMAIVNLLGPWGYRLGIDHMIYARTIWSATSPGGRYYTGVHPHWDHIHIGLTRNAGANLTYATLVAVVGAPGSIDLGGGTTPPPPQEEDMGFVTITKTSHKDTISQMQDLLVEAGLTPAGFKTDGVYGPATAAVVKEHLFTFTGGDESAAPGSDMAEGYVINYNMWNGLNKLWVQRVTASSGGGGATTDQVARDAAADAQGTANTALSTANAAKADAAKANASLNKIRSE